jgi:hypothetical protein
MKDSVYLARKDKMKTEHALLAAVCRPAISRELRAAILIRLNTYNFMVPDHQIIHRALSGLPPLDASEMFPALTQAVTRLGFPDLDLSDLFTERALSKEAIASLLDRL